LRWRGTGGVCHATPAFSFAGSSLFANREQKLMNRHELTTYPLTYLRKLRHGLAAVILAVAFVAFAAGTASAKDTLNAAVSSVSPGASIDPGSDQFRDSGQITIEYELNAPSFSTNASFGSFTLKLKTIAPVPNTGPNVSNYPANISITQNGSDADHNLRLSVASPLALAAAGSREFDQCNGADRLRWHCAGVSHQRWRYN
jgi:hypothetical protein